MAHLIRPLTELIAKRKAPAAILADMLNSDEHISTRAGQKLVADAKLYGIELRDYLRLAVDPTQAEGEDLERFRGLSGYEAALSYLGLPVNDNFDQGVTLDLASDTFNTYPGTRALFPEVVDDMVQWKYRQDLFETLAPMISNSRTISGTEMITTVVDDGEANYQGMRPIAELANIPVRSIRTTEKGVKMYKHGGGYRTSYEFSRRARLDLLTPFANRMNREFERSKVAQAVSLLINGDGTSNHPAATVVDQGTLTALATPTVGKISYQSLLQWLVARAQVGAPVDTVVGNWDMYLQWLAMFAVPNTGAGDTNIAADNMARAGFQIGGVPILQGRVNFALASNAPASNLIGFTRGETLEELVEAGSLIEESQRMPTNQSVTYYKTEVSGLKLTFGDTRSILNIAA